MILSLVVASLKNDPILSGRSIWSFRHLELHNPSTGSGIICLVQFFTTIGVVAPLKNHPILLGRSICFFRHLKIQNPSIIAYFIWGNKNMMDGRTHSNTHKQTEKIKIRDTLRILLIACRVVV